MLANRIRMAIGKLKKLIDRTTPALVINQPYSTEGNGGRKLVRLENGWLVAGTFDSINNYIYLYISKNSGETFTLFASYSTSGSIIRNFTLSSYINTIYVMFGLGNLSVRFYSVYSDGTRSGVVYIDTGQTAIGKVSLTKNKEGTELHACWSSKNSTYPNSFNIRYRKGIINGDGSVTWGSVEQLMTTNLAGFDNIDPTIVVHNGFPCIIYAHISTSGRAIILRQYTGSSWITKTIYNGTTYLQSSPSACVDKDGVIHVAWHGVDSDDAINHIRYSKSTNGGANWSAMQKLTTGTSSISGTNPSITTNTVGDIFILSNRGSGISGTLAWYMHCLKSSGVWVTQHQTQSGIRGANFSTLLDNSLEFENPLTISMKDNAVQFSGKWYE